MGQNHYRGERSYAPLNQSRVNWVGRASIFSISPPCCTEGALSISLQWVKKVMGLKAI